MAQEKVTSYFVCRKKPSGLQPSKRRKCLQNTDIDSLVTQEHLSGNKVPDPEPIAEIIAPKNVLPVSLNLPAAAACAEPAKCTRQSARTKSKASSTSSRGAGSGGSRTSTRSGRRKKAAAEVPVSCKITDLFPKIQEAEIPDSGFDDVDGPCPQKSEVAPPINKTFDIASAFIDDHAVTPPASPRKRFFPEDVDSVAEITRKRGRPHKSTRKDHLLESLQRTPEPGYDFSSCSNKKQTESTTSVRKKLILHSKPPENETQATIEKNLDIGPVQSSSEQTKKIPVEKEKSKSKATAVQKVLDQAINSPPKVTEHKTVEASRSKAADLKIDGKLKSMEEIKLSLKSRKVASPSEMKTKLAKCGKLAELQEQLAKLNENVKKVEKTKAKAEELAKEEKVKPKEPAYERYHALAQPAPPTLVLPYKYKLLNEMFRSTDTVVSMLHNRTEICTFSKLKTAVQNMVRRAFEHKMLSQIRRVFPAAYQFRQEKGLPQFGGKSHDYQLTVEASLDQKAYKDSLERVIAKSANNKKEKQEAKATFTASALLDRKNIFHNNLVDIVKSHHRDFLSKLDRPLSVPDDKLTRWHPKFNVDGVPDVEPAPLPEAPYVQKFVTAKDVMEHASGRLPKRVEAALAKVAAASENKPETKNTTPETISANTTGLKGVSQSLLDRIRLKEAKKTELAMTRTPADDRKLEMLSRLPNLVRVLRTIFVTEKKPAIPLDVTCSKLADSYKSGISVGEVEKHLDLMVELIPEWIKIVSTSKGRFLKVDKNQDITVIVEKAEKILKEKQST